MEDFNSLRDLLDSQHLSLCCRLHSWIAHHSVELPEPESEASLLFAARLFRMSTVSSTIFCLLNSRHKHLPTRRLRRFLKPVLVPVLVLDACLGPCLLVATFFRFFCTCSFLLLGMLFCHSTRGPGLSVTTLSFELGPLLRPRFHQGLGCLDEPLARPRADPLAPLRTHSQVLRVSRALYPRHGRGFCRAACGPLLCVAGNASSLEGLYRKRRSAPFIRLCSALFPAIVHSSALVRRVLLRSLGCSPAEAQSLRLSAAVAAALGFVPHGQWALLDADMLALIDRSACRWSQFFPPSPRSGHDFPSFPFAGHSSRPGSRRSLVRPLRELSPHCHCLSARRLCPSHL